MALLQTISQTHFNSSSVVSDDENYCCVSNTDSICPEFSITEVAALRKLSENLESLFDSPNFGFCSDARFVIGGVREVAVHRCILSARSPFFRQIFAGKLERKFELKELAKDLEVGYDAFMTVLFYLYSGKVKPPPREVCICVDVDCLHQSCRPAVDFLVEVLYASFVFQIAEMVTLYQRHLLYILDKVATDDVLVILSVAHICEKVCGKLLTKCIESVVNSDVDTVTLKKTLPQSVVNQIMVSRIELGLIESGMNGYPDKHVERVHKALDSDDVELVRMLLNEEHTNLDDAYALHYAVAYCDPKTTTKLLDIGFADVNHKNSRGHTVLHVAAMRREPKILVSLLTKGARPSDLTQDGRKALQISKRLTKSIDYFNSLEKGKASAKEKLCIEVLEQAECRDPLLLEDASASLAMAGDELRANLLYFENRVDLAKLLFPEEAQVAMDIAHVDSTRDLLTRGLVNQRKTVDLNESPKEHQSRMKALSRTVELGRCFFPRCSKVLDGIMDDFDLSELAWGGTSEERALKRKRYMELQESLAKAFTEDKEEKERSAMFSSSSSLSSSSSSSTSMGISRSKIAKR